MLHIGRTCCPRVLFLLARAGGSVHGLSTTNTELLRSELKYVTSKGQHRRRHYAGYKQVLWRQVKGYRPVELRCRRLGEPAIRQMQGLDLAASVRVWKTGPGYSRRRRCRQQQQQLGATWPSGPDEAKLQQTTVARFSSENTSAWVRVGRQGRVRIHGIEAADTEAVSQHGSPLSGLGAPRLHLLPAHAHVDKAQAAERTSSRSSSPCMSAAF